MDMKHLKETIIYLCLILVLFTSCTGLFSPGWEPGGDDDPEGKSGQYKITYINMDGAKNHISNPAAYTINSPTITLQSPSKANVYFVCWRLNTTSGKPVSSIPAGSTGGKTFYAQWTTAEEFNVIAETNRVRNNPKEYAAMLQAELSAITNTTTRSEYQDAITTLNASTPRGSVNFERGLYFAARDHADDLIRTNSFSHDSSNGTVFAQRLRLYGTSFTYAGENIAGGTSQNTGAKMVKQWVLSPGHLGNILNANYTQLGASLISGHPKYNWISVQDFARGFISTPL